MSSVGPPEVGMSQQLTVVLLTCIVLTVPPATSSAQDVETNSSNSRTINQSVRTQLWSSTLVNGRYVTEFWNWSQSVTANLSVPGTGKLVTLAPCPVGMSTDASATKPFYVYIPTNKPEAALVTGGTCTSGASTGTIIVTTTVAHANGANTVRSAYSGIQEALNDCGVQGCGVTILPTGADANALNIYATIYDQSTKSSLRGEGKPLLLCHTRSVCLFLGDRFNSNDFVGLQVSGVRFAPVNTFDGLAISNTACATNTATLTVRNTGSSAVNSGDWFDVQMWGIDHRYGGIHQATSGTSGSQITYTFPNCGGALTIASVPAFGKLSLENAGIEDNSEAASLEDLYFSDRNSNASFGFWQNEIVVDADQAFKLDTFANDEGPHCTSNYCGQSIYLPGPFGLFAGVAWLNHLNLTQQCGGNGVTDFSGNTLRIQNSVIQGFAQWGIYDGTLRGGYGGGQFDDVYEEAGGCVNPYYSGSLIAQAGLINSAGANTIHGGNLPSGADPIFATLGNRAQLYYYCVVVHDSLKGVSRCFKTGYAYVDGTSSSGAIPVQFPRVQGTGTITYDIVRYTRSPQNGQLIEPYTGNCGGGSTTACGSVVTALPQCSRVICSFRDTASEITTSYHVPSPSYVPGIFWWPGGLVTLSGGDGAAGTAPTYIDNMPGSTTAPIVTGGGLFAPQVFAQRCGATQGGEWVSCLAGDSSGNSALPNATILQYGVVTGGPQAGTKGRLNFTSSASASINSGEIITLVDSDPAKTLATPGNRPKQDRTDSYIGMDQGSASDSAAQLAYGAPVAQSFYIGSAPDGSSYKERLTLTLKSFRVPIQIKPAAFSVLPACRPETEGEMSPVIDSSTNTWGAPITGGGTNHVLAYCDGAQWTVAAK